MFTLIRTKDGKELCRNCLAAFSTEDVLKKHEQIYLQNRTCEMKYLEEGSIAIEDFYQKTSFYIFRY